MTPKNLKTIVLKIVEKANDLKNKYVDEQDLPVNYACIFSQSQKEYEELLEVAQKIGKVIQEAPTGLLFHIHNLPTCSGVLKLLKIRILDSTRPERGDADFTINNFSDFKKKYLSKSGFKLIKKREAFEMLELMDSEFNVRVYFSNPPLDQQVEIKKKMKETRVN